MKLAVIIPGALDEKGLRLRVNHIRQFTSKDTDIVPLTFKNEPRGIKTGADVSLLAAETMELAMSAERQGADAVVIHGICDFGLEAARGAVDIPVIGLGSAAIHLARQLADSFGVVSKSDVTIPEFTRRIRLMGCARWMTSMRPLNIPEGSLYERNRELKKRFIEIRFMLHSSFFLSDYYSDSRITQHFLSVVPLNPYPVKSVSIRIICVICVLSFFQTSHHVRFFAESRST